MTTNFGHPFLLLEKRWPKYWKFHNFGHPPLKKNNQTYKTVLNLKLTIMHKMKKQETVFKV